MDSCIFCQIISRNEDAYILYEDDLVCCFLDINPINKGHTLVVPKKHYQEFSDVDSLSLTHVIQAAQQVATALEEIVDADGITVMQNNGLFKDVEHYHMHVFPRFRKDGFSWVEPDVNVGKEEFDSIRADLRKMLKF